MANWTKSIFILLIFGISTSGCYSLKGVSIPPDVSTFYVADFGVTATNAPATISQEFTEELKMKITNESRLIFDENNPNIEFSGNVVGYRVISVAPQEGNTTALTRLDIRVKVNYSNNLDEDKDWQKDFSFYWDFDSSQDLLSNQDEFINIIFEKILEDVFNEAFTGW